MVCLLAFFCGLLPFCVWCFFACMLCMCWCVALCRLFVVVCLSMCLFMVFVNVLSVRRHFVYLNACCLFDRLLLCLFVYGLLVHDFLDCV